MDYYHKINAISGIMERTDFYQLPKGSYHSIYIKIDAKTQIIKYILPDHLEHF